MTAITPDQLIRAIANGMFPMAPSRYSLEIEWIEPTVRGIMPLDGFQASRTLQQKIRSRRFEVTVDRAFEDVVAKCAEVTPARVDSWISPTLESVFAALHKRGQAHSIECWLEGTLRGGLFGISLGALFVAESKFSRVSDASKVAFAHLVERLRIGGYRLLDCQFISPHLASLGAVSVEQVTYRKLLDQALMQGGVDSNRPLAGGSNHAVDFFAIDRVCR